jgi:KUP system potassium uptake protein
MIIWFIVIGGLGLGSILKNKAILLALNPYYAVTFLLTNEAIAWAAFGGAILVITGAEALYADMGHFGKRAIKRVWMLLVFPSLSLNYLGQGALLLSDSAAITNPFYLLAPDYAIYPLVALSVMATIIASQAVISGIFSLIWQALMLNYLPRMKVKHTSSEQRGQIYIPIINVMLCILTISAVLFFQSSEALASAYGLTVSGVMMISTILVGLLAYYNWQCSILRLLLVFVPLIILDMVFLLTNIIKIFEGAWFTLIMALIVIYITLVWRKGNQALKNYQSYSQENIQDYLKSYLKQYSTRIPGCAIFMSRSSNKIPHSLAIHLKHNKFLHEKLLCLSIATEEVPKVSLENKFVSHEILPNIFCVQASFGFHEIPDLNQVIAWLKNENFLKKEEKMSVFLGKSWPFPSKGGYLRGFSENIYIFLARNAFPAYEFFKIDNNDMVELVIRYRV